MKAHSVIHAQPILECFGYRLEAEGASFAYSGDAGPCKAMEDLARNADVMVHMCHFISGTALNAEFEKRQRRPPRDRPPGTGRGRAQPRGEPYHRADGRAGGARAPDPRDVGDLHGNLFFGEDLMEIPLGAPGPRKLD